MAADHVLVVGAGAAGVSTVDALRRKGFTGRVTLLAAEEHPPYDRPPLSKQILSGSWEPSQALLRSVDASLVCDAAEALDVAARAVRTRSGRLIGADAVVLATGASPRPLVGQEAMAGVHVLRTLDDALRLRAALTPGPPGRRATRLVVVGDGVLGAEVAATAVGLGVDVTLAGPQRVLMGFQLGDLIGGMLRDRHSSRGVALRLGAAVTGLEPAGGPEPATGGAASGGGRVTGVRLGSGEVLPADVVVVALGAAPVTDWLAGSGLTLADGVVCDSRCRAAEGVYAVGDVARWHHEGLAALVRLENRTNAAEQAAVVAANVLGGDVSYAPIPFFWTEQFGIRLHLHGIPTPGARVSIVDGSVAGDRFVALYQHDQRPVAVLGWNMPKQARLLRTRLVPVGGRA